MRGRASPTRGSPLPTCPVHTYLPDDLMVKVNVASMAHGLEARSSLLDHVLMDWAAGIPAELRMARGVTKALFKSVMEPYLPPELLYRPKMGFSPQLISRYGIISKS
jgi:asparagine synthase (glutamine-hydrolysing)